MLVLSRKVREQIHIGNEITITILKVNGQSVRVGIDAPRNVRVLRAEIPRLGNMEPSDSETPAPPIDAGRSEPAPREFVTDHVAIGKEVKMTPRGHGPLSSRLNQRHHSSMPAPIKKSPLSALTTRRLRQRRAQLFRSV